ncbi:hypothetical protein JOM56_010395 [Amanita muscaria]
MRSVSLWFLALLLLPSLVLAKSYSPTPNEMPKHGDFVTYSHNDAEHRGIVVGTEHQVYHGRPLRVAPLTHHSPSPPADVIVHSNQLMEMHPGHAVPTGHSNVAFASDIARSYYGQQPTIWRVHRRRVYSLIV